MESYINLNYVYDQVGALAEVTANFDGISIKNTLGDIVVIINGVSLALAVGEVLDESVLNGITFQVTGTGTWKGFLRGTK